ncbi:DNA-binding protein RHL1 [Gracilariopsis chorda]|uniref:DNA-binding protein RHL1 n=1 Tax=Gracilariopsis chorda TaxID=448386 RepID=A0A2V3IRU6_9FLOR|nr:DNA-binding protein RHL1 [Gracilariopsis chorda]|eukprot:PXF44834.1 DNA-binding protein RHL1 [Gracilariopsis chorda]
MGRKKKHQDLEPEKTEAEITGERLRSRANKTILSLTPSNAQLPIPKQLQRGDNADITKRNTSRKKKYLFLFPGALELAPGARIGELRDLNTTNPVLSIDVPGGHIVLRGTLVFPKNAFLTLKAGRGCREMRVTDTLDTIVAFSEWMFVRSGRTDTIPSNIPEELIRAEQTSLWKCHRKEKRRLNPDMSENDTESPHANGVSEAPTRSNPRRGVRISNYAERDLDNVENTDNSNEPSTAEAKPIEQIDLIDSDEDESISSFGKARIAKRRKRPIVHLSDESEEEQAEAEANNENAVPTKRCAYTNQKRKYSVSESSEEDDEVNAVRNDRTLTPRSSARKRRNVNYSQNFADDDSDDGASDNDDNDDDYEDHGMDTS